MKVTIVDGKFEFGELVTTRGAAEKVPTKEMSDALYRHAAGDWGDLCEEDKKINEDGLDKENPGRLMSVYKTKKGTKFWIITEWDRSVTTVLLPDEY